MMIVKFSNKHLSHFIFDVNEQLYILKIRIYVFTRSLIICLISLFPHVLQILHVPHVPLMVRFIFDYSTVDGTIVYNS